MGTTPGSYPLTSADLRGLSGIGDPFTSENLAARSDVPDPFTSADLLGLSDSNPPIWTAGTWGSSANFTKPCTASMTLTSSGNINFADAGTDGSWLPSGASAGNYRAKWVKVSGTNPGYSSGWTSNTWLSLSANRQLSLLAGLNTIVSGTYTITIQETATGAQIVKNINLDAESGGL